MNKLLLKIALPEHGIGYLLRRAHRLFSKELAKRLAEHDVPLAHFHILRVLWESDGRTQTALSDAVEVERAALTGVFVELEARGLIRRKRDQNDLRRIHVTLTKRGAALRGPLMAIAREVIDDATNGVPERDLACTIATIERLSANLLNLK